MDVTSMNKNAEILGKMDVRKALVTLSVPAILGMLVNALYNLVDSLFVGWGAGEIAIGALTLAFPVQMIVYAFALMIGIGGASVFSRAYGRKDFEAMDLTFNTALKSGILISLMVMVVGLVFMDELLLFFGATPSNIGFAQDYLSIILFGIAFQSVSMILNNFTRAEGRAKVAMQGMMLGAGLNIVLDPIFIFDWGLGLGVQGAAAATIISQITAAMYLIVRVYDKNSKLNIRLKQFFQLDLPSLWETIIIGMPTFFRNATGAFITIFVLKIIQAYSGDLDQQSLYISMFGVVNRVLLFIYLPGFGLVQGLAPLAGYNFGARNWERLIELIKFSLRLLTIYFIGGFIFIMVGANWIFDVFSASNNTEFIETGGQIFRIVTAGIIMITFQIIAGSVYQSFGYPKRALFISLSRQLIFFVPFALIFTQLFGITGLWLTYFASDICSGVVGIFMIRHELKDLGARKIEISEKYV